MLTIVIALGGNALGNTPQEQLKLVRQTASPIVDLIEDGHKVILTHGNGPQVGMINLISQIASDSESIIPEIPFAECGAMSQGYIGYHLQNAIREELLSREIKKPVATIVTQVIVSKDDPAFKSPSKPIGSFYSKEEAKLLEKTKKWEMVEDSGRGWRRIIPSPMPLDIVEKESILELVNKDHIVITVGGGGIPVTQDGNRLIGVPAVIDKDIASSKLAELLDADYLIMLTGVEKVAINYASPEEKWLSTINTKQVKQYIKEGHFAPGSMLPKIEAALSFAESKTGRKALITSIDKAKEGIEGRTGTVISENLVD